MHKKTLMMTFSLAAAAAWLWSVPAMAQDDEKEGDKAAATEVADEPEMLTIGSKAPSIDVEHWISDGGGKFKPVKEFESGKVYVVEFWATWCPPCIASMPHIAETQARYGDKGVQIISVSDEDLETVETFLKKPVDGDEEAMADDDDGDDDDADDDDDESQQKTDTKARKTFGELTSVYCLTADPDSSVHKDFFEAAGQTGIPCCFIVGKTGLIEWIGHPMKMDEPLEQVVDGSWDRETYLAEFKQQQAEEEAQAKKEAELGKFLRPIISRAQSGDFEGALELIEETRAEAGIDADTLEALASIEARIRTVSVMQLLQEGDPEDAAKAVEEFTAGTDDAEALNQISWTIYELAAEDDEFSKDLLKAATAAAEKGVKITPDDGAILDTLAHLEYLNGNLDRAIELQTRALKNPGQFESDIKEFLAQLKKEKADK
jgi:thiol-disulfide isomerase/thioredoxin